MLNKKIHKYNFYILYKELVDFRKLIRFNKLLFLLFCKKCIYFYKHKLKLIILILKYKKNKKYFRYEYLKHTGNDQRVFENVRHEQPFRWIRRHRKS